MVSPAADYPIHQIADFTRHVGTGDRNFYDRYYFNLHVCSGELAMVMGMGQYPNLATQDAFAVVRRGDKHRVVRASRELGDRMDTSVGPFRIEVIEGLKKVRVVLEPSDYDISFDLMWEGAMPAHEEPPHDRRPRVATTAATACRHRQPESGGGGSGVPVSCHVTTVWRWRRSEPTSQAPQRG